jgi:hypothetical protein
MRPANPDAGREVRERRPYGTLLPDALEAKKRELGVPANMRLMSVDEAKTHATWLDGDFKDTCIDSKPYDARGK